METTPEPMKHIPGLTRKFSEQLLQLQRHKTRQNGVLNCDDSYDSKIADFDSYLNKFPHLKSYFQTRLKPLLDKYVFLPLQNGPVIEQWTNNNSESMNNCLKQSLDWKPHKLPDLITKINEISAFQINDLRQAIQGNGNYILEDTLQQHRVPQDV